MKRVVVLAFMALLLALCCNAQDWPIPSGPSPVDCQMVCAPSSGWNWAWCMMQCGAYNAMATTGAVRMPDSLKQNPFFNPPCPRKAPGEMTGPDKKAPVLSVMFKGDDGRGVKIALVL